MRGVEAPRPVPSTANPMRLGTYEVGRKTPLDGKLEIDGDAAQHLHALVGRDRSPNGARASSAGLAESLALAPEDTIPFVLNAAADAANSERGNAKLVSMPCTCAKGGTSGSHTHHFLQAPAFAKLAPATALTIDLEANGELRIGRAVGA